MQTTQVRFHFSYRIFEEDENMDLISTSSDFSNPAFELFHKFVCSGLKPGTLELRA